MSAADETVVVDQSGPHILVSGADRVRFVNGMCTGNVATIAPGGWLRTAMLNPKGRVLSVFDVVPDGERLLLVIDPALLESSRAILERHAIADEVAFEIVERSIHRIWDSPAAVWSAPPVLAPPPTAPSTAEAVEVRRIEAGLPRFGVDLSEENFPFETPLVRLIDYTKGCYIGQEPVARVAARGSASKMLCGLALEGGEVPAAGAPIAGEKELGKVTSAARSPRFGVIALGYLARGHWEPGGAVTVGGAPAVVASLPFG